VSKEEQEFLEKRELYKEMIDLSKEVSINNINRGYRKWRLI